MLPFRFRPLGLLSSMRTRCAVVHRRAFLSLSAARAHEGHDHDDAGTRGAGVVDLPARRCAVGAVRGRRHSQSATGCRSISIVSPRTSRSPMPRLKVTIGDARAGRCRAGRERHLCSAVSSACPGADSVEVVFDIAATGGDDLLVGCLHAAAGAARIAAVLSCGQAVVQVDRLASVRRSEIRSCCTIVTFALGILFGHLQRSGRVVPAIATARGSRRCPRRPGCRRVERQAATTSRQRRTAHRRTGAE